jgi:hypothetical protein
MTRPRQVTSLVDECIEAVLTFFAANAKKSPLIVS